MTKGYAAYHARVLAWWLLGIGLVSWRYLWQTTPLHRVEEGGDVSDLPSGPPAELVDQRCQLVRDGVGPLFHRRFGVRIESSRLDTGELIGLLADDLNRAVPSEVVAVRRTRGEVPGLRVGDELLLRLPGPWNAPVRVIGCDPCRFRMATLRGHLEAGQIEFRARSDDQGIWFEIEAWARPATPLVHLLYTRVRLAKEMQFNMWVRFCLRVADLAGGHARDGVHIHTRRTTV